ncbi:hypothetical protein ACFHW2_05595 [Actinomadura sp. LOL_016]|uniref:hypothetical protein n=1 Tax=unclassified Actinomadura TaxID=2626254 RepID=UPI003A810D18
MSTPPDADDVAPNPARTWTPPDALASPEAPETAEPPVAGSAAKTERTAVAALVTGLVGLVPVAIALAVAALVRLRRGTRKGEALAITGWPRPSRGRWPERSRRSASTDHRSSGTRPA